MYRAFSLSFENNFPRTNRFRLDGARKNRGSEANPFLKFRSCTSDLHLENIRTPYTVSQKTKRERETERERKRERGRQSEKKDTHTRNKKKHTHKQTRIHLHQKRTHQQLAEQITLQDSSDFHQSIGKLHLRGKRGKKEQKERRGRNKTGISRGIFWQRFKCNWKSNGIDIPAYKNIHGQASCY